MGRPGEPSQACGPAGGSQVARSGNPYIFMAVGGGERLGTPSSTARNRTYALDLPRIDLRRKSLRAFGFEGSPLDHSERVIHGKPSFSAFRRETPYWLICPSATWPYVAIWETADSSRETRLLEIGRCPPTAPRSRRHARPRAPSDERLDSPCRTWLEIARGRDGHGEARSLAESSWGREIAASRATWSGPRSTTARAARATPATTGE